MDFGGPRSDIFIPKCKRGEGSTGLGNIPEEYQFFFTASLIKKCTGHRFHDKEKIKRGATINTCGDRNGNVQRSTPFSVGLPKLCFGVPGTDLYGIFDPSCGHREILN